MNLNTFRLVGLLVTILLVVAGCGFSTKVVVPDPPNGGSDGDELVYLFKNDLSESEIGGPPVGWNYSATYGIVEVVEAPELPSGKAVRIKANSEDSRAVSLTGYLSDPPASDANRIAIEHAVRWDHGRGINLYIRTSADHNLNWYITDGGEIFYRGRNENNNLVNLKFGDLTSGWHRVRIIADREENEVYVYFDDMETPALGPYKLREPLDTWANAYVSISHTTYVDGTSEAYYGDVKVWVLD